MPSEVRKVADLANLATLLGIDFGSAKSALTVAPLSILKRSEARSTTKGLLCIIDTSSTSSSSGTMENTQPNTTQNKKKTKEREPSGLIQHDTTNIVTPKKQKIEKQ